MINVLFTPAGSGMAVTGIMALRNRDDVRIVATDIDDLAPGLLLSDAGYLVPRFDDEDYVETVFEIVDRESIDVLIPSLDPVLKTFAELRPTLRERGVRTMISPPQTIAVCRDKWETYRRLADNLPFPDSTVALDGLDSAREYFVKPRAGSGSKDAYHAGTMTELEFYYERVTKPIVQEYLPGTEYTVDCLADPAGDLLACVPRRRIETTGGISTKVEVVRDDRLADIAVGIAERLELVGPFFFQAKEDDRGRPRITEIGPRIAGTMCPGFATPNLHSLALDQLMGEEVYPPEIHHGRRLTRYWTERYVEAEESVAFDLR